MYEDDFDENEDEFVKDNSRKKHRNDNDDQMDIDNDLNSLDTFKKQKNLQTKTRQTINQSSKTSSTEKESNDLLSITTLFIKINF